MNRIKCTGCGFVAFSSEEYCKKCKHKLINSAVEPEAEAVKFGIPTFSINGCGITLIDYQKSANDFCEVMKWVVIIGVPVLPLSGWLIAPRTFENTIPGSYQTYQFGVVGKIPLKPERVLRIMGINVISLVPIVLFFIFGRSLTAFFDNLLGDGMGFWAGFAAMGLSILWLLGIHWYLTDNGHENYLRKTSEAEDWINRKSRQ